MGVNGVNLYRLVCYWVSQVYSDIEYRCSHLAQQHFTDEFVSDPCNLEHAGFKFQSECASPEVSQVDHDQIRVSVGHCFA